MMSRIEYQQVAITTTGAAGSATGSGTTIPINGFLLDVYIDYNVAAPATTDVTISDPVFGDLVVKSNNNTDCKLAPREPACDAVAVELGLYDPIPLNGPLTVSVAQADALTDCVIVTFRWVTP
jgi:hypothetical protein